MRGNLIKKLLTWTLVTTMTYMVAAYFSEDDDLFGDDE